MALPFPPRLVQDPVRLVCGQPLIPQMDGKPGKLSQFPGKRLGLHRSRTAVAGEVQRVADHDACHCKTTRQARQRAKVVAGIAFAFEG